MNKQVHRLVFDRRRGMRVPAAEHVRSAGKAAGGQSRARSVVMGNISAVSALAALGASIAGPWLVGMAALAATGAAEAQQRRTLATSTPRSSQLPAGRVVRNLPVLSTATARTLGNHGNFSVGPSGDNTLQIEQTSQRVVINWDSFDIGRGYTVRFVQPTGGAALNNIWAADPSVILGNLKANGEVILQNQNGVIFGPTARVETARFVTTALKLANETFLKGIRADRSGGVVFGGDDQTNQGFISIERGAEIKALAGGDVIMVAPKVYNEGDISTPSGQTILAAGQKVYLYSSTDPAQRGLLVAVNAFEEGAGAPEGLNTVEHAAGATVTAQKGIINLVGMTVRQNGTLTASTAVKGQNGAIYLQAQKTTREVAGSTTGSYYRVADELGSVELGEGSKTKVDALVEYTLVDGKLEATTQKDAEAFYRSRIDVIGKDVRIRSGAEVNAVSGNVNVLAAANTRSLVMDPTGSYPVGDDGSLLVVEAGARISAAGKRDVALPMSRNQLSTQLFQLELAGSPVQRNGVVYRTNIYADARRQLSIGDARGAYNLIQRNADELSVRGGNVRIEAQGKAVVSDGAKIDISGGSVRYEPGQIFSTVLSGRYGATLIENAQSDTLYTSLINPGGSDGTVSSRLDQLAHPVTLGYVEGADAGSLVLAGTQLHAGADIRADVVVGPLQRAGRTAGSYGLQSAYVSTNGQAINGLSNELGRARALLDQPHLYASLRPMGGQITIGRVDTAGSSPVFLAEAIRMTPQVERAVGGVPEFGTDAAADFFGALTGPVRISSQSLQQSGAAQVNLLAERVDVALGGETLNLGASGILTAKAGQAVNWSGAFKAEGGKVELEASRPDGDVLVSASSVIDLSGRQRDERRQPGAADAVNVNGGSFGVVAGRSADLSGAVVDVSGGLWVSAAGSVVEGTAGSISAVVNHRAGPDRPTALDGVLSLERTDLRAYDFSRGGSLTLSGMRALAIGEVAAGDSGFDQGLMLDAGFFSRGGFGAFKLSALGHVEVTAGTQVQASLVNKVARRTRTGDASITDLVQLEAGLREPISIALSATSLPYPKDPAAPFSEGGSVTIGEGAALNMGTGGKIALSAGRNVTVAGTLRAQGGSVSLNILGSRGGANANDTTDSIGYIPDQAIRLKAGGEIDVSGVARTVSSVRGTRTTGEVLSGGVVNLNGSGASAEPARGLVITEAGSLINVSGASADMNLSSSSLKTRVSQGAGEVHVASAEGFVLAGELKAERPDASVGGGLFTASVSREGKADAVQPEVPGYPEHPGRELLLLANADEVAAHPLAYGQGVLSAGQLLDAGFDRIALRADDRIVLGTGADLKASADPLHQQVPLRSVELNSPVLKATDDQLHTIQASHVSLGDRNIKPQASLTAPVTPLATAGQAQLAIQAGLIEVHGRSALQGFDQATLDATLSAQHQLGQRRDGEVRFIGRTFGAGSSLDSEFNFDKQLTLRAGVVYATTLSNALVKGRQGDSVLTIEGPTLQGGSTSATPLSALAQLTLQAHDIHHHGVIRQPFGSVTLNAANTTTLGEHSVLSVSGEGVVVPVGSTVNQRQWVYATNGTFDGVDLVNDPSVKKLDDLALDKGITVKGATLSISDKAALEAQAGGDLQAWEFVSGVGGLADTFSRPGVFAIVPNYRYDFAPHDAEVVATSLAAGNMVSAGDQVTISTPNGLLAAGTYTLLPARYGLMPGAVLVSATQLASAGQLKQAIQRDDGSIVVSGTRTSVGTSIRGGNDPRLAWVIEPAATFRAQSATVLSSINDYKAEQARRLGQSVPTRPIDGGALSLNAASRFDWAARFNLTGGQFALSMGDRMEVVGEGKTAMDGFAAVSAQALTDTGARSILLGGERLGGGRIGTLASEVVLGSSVSAGELIAVAQKSVVVRDGVTVASTGASSNAANALFLDGEGAALVVSDRINTELQRTLAAGEQAGAKGSLELQGLATLAGVSVQLDATERLSISDAAAAQLAPTEDRSTPIGALGIGAKRIALGGRSDDAQTVSVTDSLLMAANSVKRLQLRAYDGLEVLGAITLGSARLEQLVIDAPQVRGTGGQDAAAVLTAQDVTLRNTSGRVASGAATGVGSLTIVAEPGISEARTGGLTIGSGAQRLAFDQVHLTSRGDVVLDGAHTALTLDKVSEAKDTLTTTGTLTITAARVTASTAAVHRVSSDGVLTVAQADQGRTLGEQRGLGAQLTLEGARVVQDGTIDLASGKVNIKGSGQAGQQDTVVFTDRSVTSTKGVVAEAGKTWAVSSPGGHIAAQATTGHVVVNGTLDVSAPALASASDTAKSAGSISLTATDAGAVVQMGSQARLLGSAATDTLSGTLKVDATGLANGAGTVLAGQSKGTLDRLAQLADAGGLRGEIDLRIRQGDQSLDTQLKAVRVALSADQGSMTLMQGARIDATAPQGGVVQVAAGDDVVLQAGASIRTDSSRVGANGGDVLLSSRQGRLRLEEGASISAKGDDTQDGRIVLRTSRDDRADDAGIEIDPKDRVAMDPIRATLAAGETVIEAVRTYEGYDRLNTGESAGTTLGQDTLLADTAEFMQRRDAILQALSLQDQPTVHLRSGVEIRAASDFEVVRDWNLYEEERTGGEPIMLSILAGRHLTLTGSISDGFTTAGRGTAASGTSWAQAGDAASFRLVAGADQSAANLLATHAGTGDLTMATGKMVRTTAGSIEMAAGRNIELKRGAGTGAIQAVAYVAGRASEAVDRQPLADVHEQAHFTDHGGRFDARAGGDIIAPGTAQLIGNWLYHAAGEAENPTTGDAGFINIAWWSNLDSFKQGFGSFGGGNIAVQAGGHISNLGVVAPTSARTYLADAASNSSALQLIVDNGGDVTVKAGGDVRGGVFMVGRGQGRIEAHGHITVAQDTLDASRILKTGAVLGLMDGQWALQAGGHATVALAYNPTALMSQTSMGESAGTYYTYQPDSGLSVSSTTGAVNWDADSISRASANNLVALHNSVYLPAAERINFSSQSIVNQNLIMVAPPQVRLTALSGDLNLLLPSRDVILFPSAQGDLSLYAAGDLAVTSPLQGGGSVLRMGDGDVNRWPSVQAPVTGSGAEWANAITAFELNPTNRQGNKLLDSTLHAGDVLPARMYAGQDILFSASGAQSTQAGLALVKHAEIVAGGDIVNLAYTGQHFDAQDITLIQAGKNFIGGIGSGGVSLTGPGELQVVAGRNIDLRTSAGIETIGNQGINANAALPDTSASIRVMAGADKAVQLDEFERLYLTVDAQARVDLVMFVKATLRLSDDVLPDLGKASGAERQALLEAAYAPALGRFRALGQAHQLRFAEAVVDRAFINRYIAPGQDFHQDWLAQAAAAGSAPQAYDSAVFRQFKDEVVMREVTRLGRLAVDIKDSTDRRENDARKVSRDALWAQFEDLTSLAGLGRGFSFAGDIDLAGSKVHTRGTGGFTSGGIDLFAPGGQVVVGLNRLTALDRIQADKRGLISYAGGSIRSISDGDFQVNSQKAFVVGEGDVLVYSARGSIDSGRGSNTDVTVPSPVPVLTPNGVEFRLPAVTTGSGIGLLRLNDGGTPGSVDLFAPKGSILALDAFVRNESGGDIRVGSPDVKGADNLKGAVKGAPVVVVGGPSINSSSPLPSDTAAGVEEMAQSSSAKRRDPNAILTVELLGLGDEPAAGGVVPDDKSPAQKDCPSGMPSCTR